MTTERPRNEILVRASREERERLLVKLDRATRETVPELLQAIAEHEAVLLRYDPDFEAPPRRLTFLQPIDAAILLLVESKNVPMAVETLISMMLDYGVCLGNTNPRADILRAFGKRGSARWRSVREKLTFDETTGRVSISKPYYEKYVRKGTG